MNELIGRVFSFEKTTFPQSSDLYSQLSTHGQEPKALMISCADSRVVPEQIVQAQPGDLFVCRNAGNMVPSYSTMNGGVSSTVEYAVVALGVRDIIVCGHSDCGAMKALAAPEAPEGMPNVVAWLRHGAAAEHVVSSCSPHLEGKERVRAVALENVIAQIAHLRTHPSVAAAIARARCRFTAGSSTSRRGRCWASMATPASSCPCARIARFPWPFRRRCAWRPSRCCAKRPNKASRARKGRDRQEKPPLAGPAGVFYGWSARGPARSPRRWFFRN
jgi:carbonic anhydrase